MRVAADEMVTAPGVAFGVSDREKVVFGKVGVHDGL
jgi:hypothetical protein